MRHYSETMNREAGKKHEKGHEPKRKPEKEHTRIEKEDQNQAYFFGLKLFLQSLSLAYFRHFLLLFC